MNKPLLFMVFMILLFAPTYAYESVSCDFPLLFNNSVQINSTGLNTTSHVFNSTNDFFMFNNTINGSSFYNNISINLNFSCDKTINYSVINTAFNLEKDYIGFIYLPIKNNNQNTLNMSIKINNTNQTIFKNYLNFVTLLPNSEVMYPILYNTTDIIGNKTTLFIFGNKSINITVRITDNTPPIIIKSNITTKWEAGVPLFYSFEITDNTRIDKVEIWVEDEIVQNFTYKESNLYEGSLNIYEIGTKQIKVVAYDIYNNKITTNSRVSVYEMAGVTFEKYEPLQLAKGYTYRKRVLTSKNIIPEFTISFTGYTNLNKNASLTLGFDGTDVAFIDVNYNQSITFKNFKGDLYLSEVFSEDTSYSITLDFDFPEYVENNYKKIIFSGTVGDITITQEKTISFAGKEVNCKVNNTGFITTSHYVCSFNLGLDTGLKNIGVYLTENEYKSVIDRFSMNVDLIQSELDFVKMKYYIFLSLFIISMVIMLSYYIFAFSGRRLRSGLS